MYNNNKKTTKLNVFVFSQLYRRFLFTFALRKMFCGTHLEPPGRFLSIPRRFLSSKDGLQAERETGETGGETDGYADIGNVFDTAQSAASGMKYASSTQRKPRWRRPTGPVTGFKTRQVGRQTGGRADRQVGVQTDRWACRQTGRCADRQVGVQTNR